MWYCCCSNYDLLKVAKYEIDMELGEYQSHIQKSICTDCEWKNQQSDKPPPTTQ